MCMTIRCIGVGVLILGAASVGSASPVVYESFDYLDGETLSGKTADAGLFTWIAGGSDIIQSPGRTYNDGTNDLVVNGNYYRQAGSATAAIDTSLWPTSLKTGDDLNAQGATIWFSFIGGNMDSGDAGRIPLLHLNNSSQGGHFKIGRKWQNTNWYIEVKGPSGAYGESVMTPPPDATELVFFVVRLQTDEFWATTMDAWANPTFGNESSLGNPDMSRTLVADVDNLAGTFTTFDRIQILTNTGPADWDEIRMGQTYDDVTTVAGLSELTWDGSTGFWADSNWSGGQEPSPDIGMIIDADSDDSAVTVAADFISGGTGPAASVAVGENYKASLIINSTKTLEVTGEIAVGDFGTLQVDGTLTAEAVSSSGTLSGSGTIVADEIEIEGTVAPGASTGTLTLQGSTSLLPSAVYEVEIGPQSTAAIDRLIIDQGDLWIGDDAIPPNPQGELTLTAIAPVDATLPTGNPSDIGDFTRRIIDTQNLDSIIGEFATVPAV